MLIKLLGIVAGVAGLIGFCTAILPRILRRIRGLPPPPSLTDVDIFRIAEELERRRGIRPELDGLPNAVPAIRDPLAEALALMVEAKWDMAVSKLRDALPLAKAQQLVALYNLLGACYEATGRWNDALETFKKSAGLAADCGDKKAESIALINTGVILQRSGHRPEALELHERALKLARELGDRGSEALAMGNIGLYWHHKGVRDKALEYIGLALDAAGDSGDRQFQGQVLSEAGLIHKEHGEWNEALEFF